MLEIVRGDYRELPFAIYDKDGLNIVPNNYGSVAVRFIVKARYSDSAAYIDKSLETGGIAFTDPAVDGSGVIVLTPADTYDVDNPINTYVIMSYELRAQLNTDEPFTVQKGFIKIRPSLSDSVI